MKGRLLVMILIGLLLTGASLGPQVEVQSDKLAVHAQGAPLSEVLRAIGQQANIGFVVIGENKIEEVPVSEEFTNLPLEQGIIRLLGKWNYALVKDQKTARLEEVYILTGRSSGEDMPSTLAERSGVGVPAADAGALGATEILPDDPASRAIDLAKVAEYSQHEVEAFPPKSDFQDPNTQEALRSAFQSGNPEGRMVALKAIRRWRMENQPAVEEFYRLVNSRASHHSSECGPQDSCFPSKEEEGR